jgi:ATP-dependent Clp protease protease subunit
MKSLVNSILSKHTNKTEKQIAKDTDRDNFMDAQSALEYGLIDEIITERNKFKNQDD